MPKWLTIVGQILLKGTAVWLGFAPTAAAAFPGQAGTIQTVSKDLAQIADIIAQVEAAGQALQLPGPQKLEMATPMVAQIIIASAIMANHQIADPVLFKQGCGKIAGGFADVLNSLHGNPEQLEKLHIGPA